jgi:hypothetical protein
MINKLPKEALCSTVGTRGIKRERDVLLHRHEEAYGPDVTFIPAAQHLDAN